MFSDDEITAKYAHLFSRVLCPGTSGIDGFTHAWFTSTIPKPLCGVSGPSPHMAHVIQKIIDERTLTQCLGGKMAAMISDLLVRDAFTSPKQDAASANQMLFNRGARVSSKAREAGLKPQPNYALLGC